METTIQTVEDSLIEGLSFKLGNSSNYILDRKSSTWYPSGGNSYSPLGVRLIKFVLAGTDWLDPGTVRLQFKLTNKDPANPMKLLNCNPSNFFRRMRIICGGQTVEDIDYYHRVSNMISHLLPHDKKLNDAIETFPVRLNGETDLTQPNILNFSPILNDGVSITLQTPLLSGLLQCGKMLPLRYLQGLQIELELVNAYIDAACVLNGNPPVWEISEVSIKADTLMLDSQLDNEYTSHLLSGKTLPINFSSYVHQVSSVGNTDRPTIALSRAFTRLKSVFITLYKKVYRYRNQVVDGSGTVTAPGGNSADEATHMPFRESTFFYHPQFLYPGSTTADDADTTEYFNVRTTDLAAQTGYYKYNAKIDVESQIQIGSKLVPEMPIRSSQEQFYQLRKTIGNHEMGSSHSIDILPHEYRSWKFIMGFDLQKALGAAFSGINTRAGDLLTIKLNNVKHVQPDGTTWAPGGNMQISYADFIHTTLEYDAILNISDNGVSVFE